MAAIPGEVETDQQPPMTIPLQHFVVGLGLLLVGVVVFSANMVAVIWNHSPHSIGGILTGSLSLRQESPSGSESASRE